jgi:hypothetical protein
LRKSGEALFGQRWQTDIAKALGIDSRRIRQWVKRERPLPKTIDKDCMIYCMGVLLSGHIQVVSLVIYKRHRWSRFPLLQSIRYTHRFSPILRRSAVHIAHYYQLSAYWFGLT